MPDQADGVKTGHTQKSGYALVGSAKSKDGKRRLILVVSGLKTQAERNSESKKIMEWGLREFNNYTILKDGKILAQIPVWLGTQKTVGVVLDEDVKMTIHRLDKTKTKIQVSYDRPAQAPIKKGDKIASLTITLPDGKSYRYPLKAAENVEKISFWGKVGFILRSVFYGDDE